MLGRLQTGDVENCEDAQRIGEHDVAVSGVLLTVSGYLAMVTHRFR